ncbi:MAG: 50S ribosomal protein L35 [Acidobacteria bacterium]|nr:50S ribosomal protein L35 [Acidobacteriota bacterium]MDW7983676.1 50S ribosomal protein L35 [Acidobacteriota bacterium]
MPKSKTKRAAAKRFRITPRGKVMHYRAWRSHLLRKKTSKRKRRLQHPKPMASGDARRTRRMLLG